MTNRTTAAIRHRGGVLNQACRERSRARTDDNPVQRRLLLSVAVLYLIVVLLLTTGAQPPARFDIVGNIVLFVPLGCLACVAWPRLHHVYVVFAGFSVSAAVELTQLVALTGRDATVNDIALNTSGTALGCVLAVTVMDASSWAVRRYRS